MTCCRGVDEPVTLPVPDMMNAWTVGEPGPIETGPLVYGRRPVPRPAGDELLLRVRACGVCRTDLHVSEGDLPVRRPHVTPGHEVVGDVVGLGSGVHDFARGDLVGMAWLRQTCGTCVYCVRGAENLCPFSQYNGWDADGGYAEYVTVPAAFAYRLPAAFAQAGMAVLLCAGSSATALWYGPACLRVGGSASTGSGAALTCAPSSRWLRGRGSMC